ncbi:enoyl-CoA hydratase-related protein [Novosphingobium sp. CECT 9465]|uniref:enoyl-CoA hydratase-related protein n=1 Tax=Novosphingobium sp. CECT 9465 TaxID=2829794 RepID=UPI001E39AB57|nr:enoyl-CoA hydratase-related protein [Novosphingobium sp. CECT 9465]CAH0496744.1 1,2-epoxyphenylacetyl-CoA isomerase [Novosphingobium sp. CECT 9465]
MEYKTILAERIGDVLKITLNRPDRLNACPPSMALEIAGAVASLDGARAVLITGAGRAFCSGADLAAEGSSSIAGGQGAHDALAQAYNPMMLALARLDVPLICAVNGAAAGIGCSIALAADFVLAARGAYFLQAFVNIGLVPDGGASWTLPRMIGKARATRMMMLGEKIGAEMAEDWGLIYKAVDDDELQDAALALASRLAAGPTVALGIMRQNLNAALMADYASALQTEAEGQKRAGDSADAHEGTAAFLEKRKPLFAGK